MPLENVLGPEGDMYCFSNTYRMLVCFEFVPLSNLLDVCFCVLPTNLSHHDNFCGLGVISFTECDNFFRLDFFC